MAPPRLPQELEKAIQSRAQDNTRLQNRISALSQQLYPRDDGSSIGLGMERFPRPPSALRQSSSGPTSPARRAGPESGGEEVGTAAPVTGEESLPV